MHKLYNLGCRKVRLKLNPDSTGGSFETAPADGIALIEVGIGMDEWAKVAAVAMHEALELAMCEMGLRFRPSPDYSDDNGTWLFVMDHGQFAEAIARAAYFLAAALPDIATAYKKAKRKRKP